MAFSPVECEDVIAQKKSVLEIDSSEVDASLDRRIIGGSQKLKFLDGVSYRGLFGVSKTIRQQCQDEERIMTIDNPVFMFSA